MAYIDKEKSKEIRKQLKAAFPEIKFSVTIDNYTSLYCCIMEAPIRFTEEDYSQLNHYYLDRYEYSNVLQRISDICNEGNHNNSDSMTDYFDVGWYFSLNVGKWDKPFKLIDVNSGRDWKNYKYTPTVESLESDDKQEVDYLSLFDSIEVKKEQTISERDRMKCEELTELFKETSEQLCKWYNLFSEASKTEVNDMFCIEEIYNGTKVGTLWKPYDQITDVDRYNSKKFTPLYDLKHIEKSYSSLLHMHENNIVSFFNSMYGLRVSNEDILKDTIMGETPDYTKVVNYIIESLEGKSFEEIAENHIVNDFKNTIYRVEQIVLKKETITLKDYLWTESNFSRGYKVSWNSEKRIGPLCYSLVYFDGCKHYNQPHNIIADWNERDIHFDDYILKTQKAASLRIFKNGRLDIKFIDSQTALEFYKFFQLDKI